jgi:carbon storage regulator CsrA
MLVLSRRRGEALQIGEDVTITILEVCGDNVRLDITAPPDCPVLRSELQHPGEIKATVRASAGAGQGFAGERAHPPEPRPTGSLPQTPWEGATDVPPHISELLADFERGDESQRAASVHQLTSVLPSGVLPALRKVVLAGLMDEEETVRYATFRLLCHIWPEVERSLDLDLPAKLSSSDAQVRLAAITELGRILPPVEPEVVPGTGTRSGSVTEDPVSTSSPASKTEQPQGPTLGEAPVIPNPIQEALPETYRAKTFRDRARWFLQGLGSVLEIVPPPKSYLPNKSDAEAIQGDWEAVGKDLWAAIRHSEQEAR